MTMKEIEHKIDALIDEFAKACPDEQFLEALAEMEDRAVTARIAREEETSDDAS